MAKQEVNGFSNAIHFKVKGLTVAEEEFKKGRVLFEEAHSKDTLKREHEDDNVDPLKSPPVASAPSDYAHPSPSTPSHKRIRRPSQSFAFSSPLKMTMSTPSQTSNKFAIASSSPSKKAIGASVIASNAPTTLPSSLLLHANVLHPVPISSVQPHPLSSSQMAYKHRRSVSGIVSTFYQDGAMSGAIPAGSVSVTNDSDVSKQSLADTYFDTHGYGAQEKAKIKYVFDMSNEQAEFSVEMQKLGMPYCEAWYIYALLHFEIAVNLPVNFS